MRLKGKVLLLSLACMAWLTPCLLRADETAAKEGDPLPYKGSMMACDNGSTTGYAQCDANGNLSVVTGSPQSEVTFTSQAYVSAPPGGTLTALKDLSSFKPTIVIVDNQSDGDVVVSMDGTNAHFTLLAGDTLNLNFAAIGKYYAGTVYIRDGSTVGTTGVIKLYAYK